MIRYQLLIEYVGTNFRGWQIQKKGATIPVEGWICTLAEQESGRMPQQKDQIRSKAGFALLRSKKSAEGRRKSSEGKRTRRNNTKHNTRQNETQSNNQTNKHTTEHNNNKTKQIHIKTGQANQNKNKEDKKTKQDNKTSRPSFRLNAIRQCLRIKQTDLNKQDRKSKS